MMATVTRTMARGLWGLGSALALATACGADPPDAAEPGTSETAALASEVAEQDVGLSRALSRASGLLPLSLSEDGRGFSLLNQGRAVGASYRDGRLTLAALGQPEHAVQLELTAVSRGTWSGAVGAIERVARHGEGAALVQRPELDEWYINRVHGVEQGFTLATAPEGDRSQPLTLQLALTGALTAQLAGAGVDLVDDAGRAVLRYGGLYAHDAQGKALAAHFELTSGAIAIVVDDRDATYPVAIDPVSWANELRIKLNTPLASDRFGIALAMDGNHAVVAATKGGAGAVYVYERNPNGWIIDTPMVIAAPAEASPSDTDTGFGTSVAISGNAVVVGAPSYGAGGAVFAYDIAQSSPEPIQLQGFTIDAASEFGAKLALDAQSGLLAASAPAENANEGAVYVFQQSGTSFSAVRRLAATTPLVQGRLGQSLAIHNALIVAATNPSDLGSNGRLLLFERTGSTWTTTVITAPTPGNIEAWGTVVAVGQDVIAAGVPGADITTPVNSNDGSVDVIFRANGVWGTPQRILPQIPTPNNRFGQTLAIDDTTLVVGAPQAASGGGVVFTYDLLDPLLAVRSSMQPIVPSQDFGRALAINGSQLMVGAPLDDVANVNSGAVYAYSSPAAPGATCAFNEDCSNGTCADGYCCDTPCADSCDRCNLTGLEGTCSIVSAGDPGAPVCESYSCDGSSAQCPSGCTSDADCVAGGCQPNGECASCVDANTSQVAGSSQLVDCTPYICGANGGCTTSCDSFEGCAQGYTCDVYETDCISLSDDEPTDEGCSCSVARPSQSVPWQILLGMPLMWLWRRRLIFSQSR